jgi:hypothetical protein
LQTGALVKRAGWKKQSKGLAGRLTSCLLYSYGVNEVSKEHDPTLPRIRWATFCRNILTNAGDPKDTSIIGVMNGFAVRVQRSDQADETFNLQIQQFALFASVSSPEEKSDKPEDFVIELSVPGLSSFKTQRNSVPSIFPDNAKFGNLNIVFDGFSLTVPVLKASYNLLAKWYIKDILIGELDLPFTVDVE